jgi:ribonucleoside-triphosphate reductase (thioredoxin)
LPAFQLSEEFLAQYKGKQPNWGPVGYITYKRTYARPMANGKSEEWVDTCTRVIEGMFSIQRDYCKKHRLPWNQAKAQRTAQDAFERLWEGKWTPPGRGLWMMGTDAIEVKGGAPLNNCAFVSTENIATEGAEPFCFMMDMSMLGVGVGFDTKGADKVNVREPRIDGVHVVADTREGWVDLLRLLLEAYIGKGSLPADIDYSNVRPFGSPINTFGGTASGPEPLREMYEDIRKLLDDRRGSKLTSADLVDIMNLVGRCVVSGNVRRSAQISFGEIGDKEFMQLKDPSLHKEELYHHRWASNNSLFAEVGMDYNEAAALTAKNGEPGYEWLKNAQAYSRMGRPADYKDYRARGGNPCLEQTLEPYELCCLVETYPSRHESLDDWRRTLKVAYLYAKTVTLVPTHNERTNSVMLRNRRIGCSISGISQACRRFGRRAFLSACEEGYDDIQHWDRVYSEWLGIGFSIKTTSVKPSGTVSLLFGVTPGIHWPVAEYYYRTIRFQEGSPLLDKLEAAGYRIEKDKYSRDTMVVYFPVKEDDFDRAAKNVSMWEQLEMAAAMQHHWADNQVSVTVTFSKEEAKDIARALELYETRLKGVSFLPAEDHGYEQAPYIPITEEEYKEASKALRKVKWTEDVHEVVDAFCDGGACQMPVKKK